MADISGFDSAADPRSRSLIFRDREYFSANPDIATQQRGCAHFE
jgi:hypothetical protein